MVASAKWHTWKDRFHFKCNTVMKKIMNIPGRVISFATSVVLCITAEAVVESEDTSVLETSPVPRNVPEGHINFICN